MARPAFKRWLTTRIPETMERSTFVLASSVALLLLFWAWQPLGGVVWGALLGVDVHLSLVGFKVFPVVILGGLDSIPGAIVGGLVVGIVENVAAGYIDPYVGGGTKDFAPYVLMIVALMFRPYGIFGKKIIERI